MQIGLGLGITSQRGSGDAPPFSLAITGLTSNPTHGPTAQTGVELTGTITGLVGGEVVTHAWEVDGTPVGGATSTTFTPSIGGNAADLDSVRYVATIDSVEYRSAARTVRYAPPTATGALSDQTYAENTGDKTVDASGDFSGSALVYFVTGPGATVNSSTGVVTIATDDPASGTITVTATNSGGAAASAFSLTVTDGVYGATITGLTSNATHGLAAETGVELTGAISGLSGGETVARSWTADAVEVGTGATFTPAIGSNVADLDDLQFTATIAGEVASSTTYTVRHAAPTASGVLSDQNYTLDDGDKTVDASGDFTGSALVYSVTGTGATINSSTGVVTITTAAERTGSVVTVTATNSGGAATSAFEVTVAAIPVPDQFETGDWSVAAGDTDAVVTLSAVPTNVTLTAIEYRLGAGSWVDSGRTTTGDFTITGLTNDTEYSITIRALSAGGAGTASAAKTVTPVEAASSLAAVFTVTSGAMVDTSDTDFPTRGKFHADGEITVSVAGWLEVEIYGQGGGSQVQFFNACGGGGGAEYLRQLVYLEPGVYPIVVGSSGVGGFFDGTSSILPTEAESSTAFGIEAIGGGRGGGASSTTGKANGGGAGFSQTGFGVGVYFNGGIGTGGPTGAASTAAGGGGMTGDGEDVSTKAGDGGTGITTTFHGMSEDVCGGGGGGTRAVGQEGSGSHGGGNGAREVPANPGAANTGGGAGGTGGGNARHAGAAGGTGRVSVRVPSTQNFWITTTALSNNIATWRADNSGADRALSGTYAGGGTAIEARVLRADTAATVVDWTEVASGISGGTWSGSIFVARTDHPLRVETRFAGDTLQTWHEGALGWRVDPNSTWHVGPAIFITGQSNAVQMMAAAGTPTDSPVKLYNANVAAYVPGSGAFALGGATSTAALVIMSGASGAPIATVAAPAGVVMPAMVTALTTLNVPVINGIMLRQGEAESSGTNAMVTEAEYRTACESIRTQVAAVTGQTAANIPFAVVSLGTQDGGATIESRWHTMDNIHLELESSMAGDVAWVSGKDGVRKDIYHYYDESLAEVGARVGKLFRWMWGLDAQRPRLSVASIVATNSTTTTITVTHGRGDDLEIVSLDHEGGTGIVDPAGPTIYGFDVTDDAGSTVVAATGVITNATTITLTHSALSTTTREVRHLWGWQESEVDDASAGMVRDNSDVNVPLDNFAWTAAAP